MPTGGGKTPTFASIMTDEPGASIVIAHRSELVSQSAMALARYGVRHRIIGPQSLVKLCSQIQIGELGRTYVDPNAKIAAAGVNTLINRSDPYFNQIRLWVIDECFPAGTMVSGRPIEDIKVGDSVEAFNEVYGDIETRKVTKLFKNPIPKHMVRVVCGTHHVLHCTQGHPFYTKRGWVDAANLTIYDEVLRYATEMHDMREGTGFLGMEVNKLEENSKDILFNRVLEQISLADIINYDGGYKPKTCVGENDCAESYAEPRDSQENEQHIEGDWSQTDTSGRERATSNRRRSKAIRFVRDVWLRKSSCNKNRDSRDIPPVLQGRPRACSSKTGNRSGRSESLREATFGQEERRLLTWVRVDSVEIQECSDYATDGDGVRDSHVYNIEVEGLHTYIANGIIVHNCHHLTRNNSWGKAVEMFPNARGLGVTATPGRADGKGLGRHADGYADVLVHGPEMSDLINTGYLSKYKIYCPPSDVDISKVHVTASGEFNQQELSSAIHASRTIVGDAVRHYLERAAGKLWISFCVDVEAATELAAAYRHAGVPAEVITGKTPPLLRAHIMRRFRNGEIKHLTNVGIVGEGVDVPAVEGVSMLCHHNSYNLYAQEFGRMLRLLLPADIAAKWDTYTDEFRLRYLAQSDKPYGILFDHVGNVVRHGGPPDVPRVWTLDRRGKRETNAADEIPIRICPNPNANGSGLACLQPYPRTLKACPHCGHYPEPAARSAPEYVDGDLLELDAATLAALRGEVARIDGDPVIPWGATPIVEGAVRKNHRLRQNAQGELRNVMAWWAGLQDAQGRSESESYRLFYFKFGVDVAGAQTLGSREAMELTEKINRELTANGIDGTVNAMGYFEHENT